MKLNKEKVHHGLMEGENKIIPIDMGTDYFCFQHKDCKGKGIMSVEEISICKCGRIILHILCAGCGFRDARKPYLITAGTGESIKVKKCKVD